MRKHTKHNWKISIATGAFLFATLLTQAADPTPIAGDLLEEGIYYQDAKGDLDSAIERYQLLLEQDSTNRPLAAEAQYRIATCYLERGDKAVAVSAFEKLVKNYPNQTKWVEAALKHLPQAFEPSNVVPWIAGERTVFEVALPNGDIAGNMILEISQSESNGIQSWIVSNRQYVNGTEMLDRTRIEKNAMISIDGVYYDNNTGRASYSMNDGLAQIHFGKNGKDSSQKYEGKLYGNAQVISLVRQFPNEVGFSTEINILAAHAGMIMPITFEVAQLETIETKLGTFECYVVKIDIMGQKQSLWVTNDASRNIVQLGIGAVKVKAISIEQIDSPSNSIQENEKLGVSFEHTNRWVATTSRSNDRFSRIEIRDPNSTSTISATSSIFDLENEKETPASDMDRLRKIAEKNINSYEKKGVGLEVDDSSWKEFTTNGATSLSYSGQMKIAEEAIYLKKSFTYLNGTATVFTLRCPINETDDFLPEFDKMVASTIIKAEIAN